MLFSGVDCHYRALKPPESNHLRPQTNHNSRTEDCVEIFTTSFSFFVWCSAWWCMIEEKDRLKSVISQFLRSPSQSAWGSAWLLVLTDVITTLDLSRADHLPCLPYTLAHITDCGVCSCAMIIDGWIYISKLSLCSNLLPIGVVSLLTDGNFNLISVCFSIIC